VLVKLDRDGSRVSNIVELDGVPRLILLRQAVSSTGGRGRKVLAVSFWGDVLWVG